MCYVQEGTGKCEALFDFEGGPGELSFVPGETITILKKVDEDWMRGRIGSKEGIFPVSFVKIITEIPQASQIKPSASSGTAIFHFLVPPLFSSPPSPLFSFPFPSPIPVLYFPVLIPLVGRPGAKTSIQSLTDDLMPKGIATTDYNARDSGEISFKVRRLC